MAVIDIEIAKQESGPLLDRVMQGEHVTIVNGGMPVARVLPPAKPEAQVELSADQQQRRREAIEDIARLRNSLTPGDYSWEEMKKLRDFGRPGCE